MKRVFVLVLALTLAVTVASSASAQANRHIGAAGPIDPMSAPKSLNPALRDISQSLAALLGDTQVRQLVKKEVGQKFDGDYEVLYRDIANHEVGNRQSLRQALGSALGDVQKRAGQRVSKETALRSLDNFASSLPQLQIAIPANFHEWDAESTVPLVAFVPVGVEDDELQEVEAFDATGRRYILDAQIEPGFPVVVVSLNERTDRNGYLLPEFVHPTVRRIATDKLIEDPSDPGGDVPFEPTSPSYSIAPANACDARSHVYGDQEILHEIKINNDHEPWLKGSPEIYATYSFPNNSQGIRGQFYMSSVDAEGRWYSINGPLFYWQSYYGNTFAMAIWEQDGSNYGTVTYTAGGLNYTLQIHDGDDSLGTTPGSFLDPNCGYYSTGDAEFKLRYVGTGTGGVCGEASCVSAQGSYISHFTGTGCTGTESYYLPYDGYGYLCRPWNGTGLCGTIHRTVTNRSYRYNGVCYDAWPSGNTLSDFVTVYR